jgi:hypothetical protein
MKSIFLAFISIIVFTNFVTGQTMEKIVDNLIKLQLIGESNKEEVRLILTRQEDTSNTTILNALFYIEMIKLVGNDNLYSQNVELPNLSRDQQDSTNKELFKYLTALNSAGLITPPVYTEFKANIEKDNYLIRYQLINDICQKNAHSELLALTRMAKEEKTLLTIKEIDDAVTNWKKIGLLNHLTKEQIEFSKNKAIEEGNDNLTDVLLNFPSVIHSFDTELENLNDPYAELLKEFSKISHGSFNPINISDNFSRPVKNKVTVKFTLNGKNYSKDFRVKEDWIDASFIDFIKQVVNENKLPRQLYELYEGGQGANIIFLTLEQYQFLKKNKLLLFPED